MFNLGMGEITVILLLALIFLGPKKLPELASGLGRLIREIRKTTSDVKNEIQLDDAIRKPLEELREAVTLPPEELKRRDKLRRDLEELQRRAQETEAAAAAVAADVAPTIGVIPAGEAGSDSATPPPVVGPGVPGAAPAGAVPREPPAPTASAAPATAETAEGSGAHAAPPSPPLAAVLAKTNPGMPAPGDHRAGGDSDFLRSLRAVPANKRERPARTAPEAASAADRGNVTQQLSEEDLAPVTSSPPPPPPAAGAPHAAGARPAPASPSSPPSRLPGTTPPKPPAKTPSH